MRRVKLLYVITKLELGGAQKQLLGLIGCLDKQKFTPFLFTAKNGLLLPQALSITGLTVKRSSFLESSINPLKDFLALVELYFFIKKNKIEIVHTHSSKAGILGRIAAKLAAVKVIVHTVHGWSFNDYQRAILRKIYISFEKLTAKFSDAIIVVSSFDKQKGLRNNIGVEKKYTLIRYGLDRKNFSVKENNVREELGITQEDLVVTNISCLKPQKSPLDFVRLAHLISKEFPNIKFLLVGDGVLRKQIEKLILKLGLQNKIILTGWRRDIPEILSISDCLVLTSLWEGLPIVVLEAMAAARPAIATNTGGVKEVVIEDKTGFLVNRRDMERMSEKVVTLLKDEALKKELGEAARRSLGFEFDFENVLKKNQSLYDKLILNNKIYAN